MEWLTNLAVGNGLARGSRKPEVPCELFAGPSIIGAPARLLATFDQIAGPIAAGDLDRRLAQSVRPTVICIADGYLDPGAAIPNGEIKRALSAGWSVWGVSSVGALKAVELASEGMKGFGLVYRLLRRFRDLTAADISVLHFPFPPYEPETISLLEIYMLLQCARREDIFTRIQAAEILKRLRLMSPYDRTYGDVRKYVPQHLSEMLDAIYHDPMKWRVKRQDLEWFCKRKPWVSKSGPNRLSYGDSR